jgi:hypothetical protein
MNSKIKTLKPDNKKWRMFGLLKNLLSKIGLVDKILIITGLLAASFFAYVFFRKADYIVATIKINEDNPVYGEWIDYNGTRPWFAEALRENVKLTDGLGRTSAEVLSIKSYDMRSNRKALYLKVRLRTTYSKRSNQYSFNGLPLTVGSIIRLNFNTVSIEGLVTDVQGLPDLRKKVKLLVDVKLEEETGLNFQTSGVLPYIAAEAMNIDEIKDGEGEVIMKVIKKHVEDADTFVVTSDGRSLVRKNPLRKDVYLTLEIQAEEIENRYYLFDDFPILIGGKLPLNTDKLSFFSKITDIKVSDEK